MFVSIGSEICAGYGARLKLLRGWALEHGFDCAEVLARIREFLSSSNLADGDGEEFMWRGHADTNVRATGATSLLRIGSVC